MNKKNILIASLAALLLASCGDSKKIVIMASGKVSVKGETITLDPGTTHNEKIIDVSAATLKVNNGQSTIDIALNEPGVYILNLKNDTLVGAYQAVGAGRGASSISQEALTQKIDSLEQLMAGKNVTAANRNFCIAPMSIARVTENKTATIIGPYLKMPSSFEGGKEYEIYKFSTNKEVAETISKLKQLQ